MNSCDKIAKHAFRYMEGSLTQRERETIEAHLQHCPACAAKYASARRSGEQLRQLPRRRVSRNFDIVLHAKLRQAAHQRRRYFPLPVTSWVWQVPAYAAAAMLLIAAGVLIDQQMDNSPSLPGDSMITAVETMDTGSASYQPASSSSVQSEQPIRRYVMEKIPMQTLLQENRRSSDYRRASLEKPVNDTIKVQENVTRTRPNRVQVVNASVQF